MKKIVGIFLLFTCSTLVYGQPTQKKPISTLIIDPGHGGLDPGHKALMLPKPKFLYK